MSEFNVVDTVVQGLRHATLNRHLLNHCTTAAP